MSLSSSAGDLVDTVTSLFKSRVSSKFGGAFAIFWLIFNWEFLYFLLLADHSVERKINYIELHFLSTTDVFCYPLFYTLLYVSIFPLIAEAAETVWNFNQQIVKRRGRMLIEGSVPLGKEEKRALYKMVHDTEMRYRELLNEKDEEIESLRALIVDQTGTVDEANQSEIEAELEEPQEEEFIETLEIYDDTIPQILKSSFGRLLVEDWLAQILNLSKNNSVQKMELDDLSSILEAVLLSYPKPWLPVPVRSANGSHHGEYSREETSALASKLESKGILKRMRNRQLLTYTISTKTEQALDEIYILMNDQEH